MLCPMKFSMLSSGSKANCTYFESAGHAILIDCGLSGRQAELRMASLGISPQSLSAIIVTHEHADHIHGVATLSRRHKIPVYANEATRKNIKSCYAFETFTTGEEFSVGTLSISPFSITHDAEDPVGFVIRSEGLKYTQVTDLGRVTPLVREAVAGSHALVLESNHDPEMLMSCGYPWELKQRISSSHGHLSNITAAELLKECWHHDLGHVVLAHLSENSNTPELAIATHQQVMNLDLFQDFICASIHEPTPLIEVGAGERWKVAV
jgi:phosphoribosyl 1,2-cyclic phosphodiesterase